MLTTTSRHDERLKQGFSDGGHRRRNFLGNGYAVGTCGDAAGEGHGDFLAVVIDFQGDAGVLRHRIHSKSFPQDDEFRPHLRQADVLSSFEMEHHADLGGVSGAGV